MSNLPRFELSAFLDDLGLTEISNLPKSPAAGLVFDSCLLLGSTDISNLPRSEFSTCSDLPLGF